MKLLLSTLFSPSNVSKGICFDKFLFGEDRGAIKNFEKNFHFLLEKKPKIDSKEGMYFGVLRKFLKVKYLHAESNKRWICCKNKSTY